MSPPLLTYPVRGSVYNRQKYPEIRLTFLPDFLDELDWKIGSILHLIIRKDNPYIFHLTPTCEWYSPYSIIHMPSASSNSKRPVIVFCNYLWMEDINITPAESKMHDVDYLILPDKSLKIDIRNKE